MGLWMTFGVNRIRPYKDSFTKKQMKEWKESKNVWEVYNDLYKSSDPEDEQADTYITLIINPFSWSKRSIHNEMVSGSSQSLRQFSM